VPIDRQQTTIGCVVALALPIVWQLQNNDAMCKTRMLLLCLAYPCVTNFVLCQTLRVHRIFNQREMRVVRLSTARVFRWTACTLIPYLLLFIIWVSVSPLRATVTVVDPARPALNFVDCESEYSHILYPILIVFIALNMVAAAQVRAFTRPVVSFFP